MRTLVECRGKDERRSSLSSFLGKSSFLGEEVVEFVPRTELVAARAGVVIDSSPLSMAGGGRKYKRERNTH